MEVYRYYNKGEHHKVQAEDYLLVLARFTVVDLPLQDDPHLLEVLEVYRPGMWQTEIKRQKTSLSDQLSLNRHLKYNTAI